MAVLPGEFDESGDMDSAPPRPTRAASFRIQTSYEVMTQPLARVTPTQESLGAAWYHGVISREEAEARLGEAGLGQGWFLVRQRDTSGDSFAISIAKQQGFVHHLLKQTATGTYTIDNKPTPQPLVSIAEVVQYLSQREQADGNPALTPLQLPSDV
jgi:hypothetical protein